MYSWGWPCTLRQLSPVSASLNADLPLTLSQPHSFTCTHGSWHQWCVCSQSVPQNIWSINSLELFWMLRSCMSTPGPVRAQNKGAAVLGQVLGLNQGSVQEHPVFITPRQSLQLQLSVDSELCSLSRDLGCWFLLTATSLQLFGGVVCVYDVYTCRGSQSRIWVSFVTLHYYWSRALCTRSL